MSDTPYVVQKVEWFQFRDPEGHAFFVMVSSLPNGFFTAVPWLIEGTMRLAILHERFVAAVSHRFEITSAEVPVPIPPMQQRLFYHEARAGDAGLIWLRDELREFVRQASISHPDA